MNKCFFGDCRDTMRQLITDGVRVNTCVTSPPYWGLRDYGHAEQLGLEETPEQYVANMVEVFSLVFQLLKDDGTLWLNLGDSYAASGKGGNPEDSEFRMQASNEGSLIQGRRAPPKGYKMKDLVGIPWMVAFALRSYGWYLRSDIIWSKPNPMPESVTDRPTKAHEYIFLMSKNKNYYYDSDAIAEKAISPGSDEVGSLAYSIGSGRNDGNGDSSKLRLTREMRNKRTIWNVTTTPYSGAHFATFPPKLIEPCIMAGCPTGGIVLDPFFGSGTTGEVAQRLGRQWIGCELNQDYAPLQMNRTAQEGLPL